jgi:murein DD-endopeptidase MepM/ murein hydrolase activator NlpD
VSLVLVPGCAGALTAPVQPTPRVPAEEVPPPVPTETAAKAADPEPQELLDGVVHVVQPGQTLWRIARAYDVPLDTIVAANGIADASRVEIGTPVFIPGVRMTLEVEPYPAPIPDPRRSRPVVGATVASFLWPIVDGALMRPFGEQRRTHKHAGVDIRGASGDPIVAGRDGTVAFAGPTRSGYGSMVVLDHGDGVQSLYGHARKTLVKPGDAVKRGDTIALVGRTGNATTEHCHFEIRLSNRPVDPMPYLTAASTGR